MRLLTRALSVACRSYHLPISCKLSSSASQSRPNLITCTNQFSHWVWVWIVKMLVCGISKHTQWEAVCMHVWLSMDFSQKSNIIYLSPVASAVSTESHFTHVGRKCMYADITAVLFTSNRPGSTRLRSKLLNDCQSSYQRTESMYVCMSVCMSVCTYVYVYHASNQGAIWRDIGCSEM